MTLQTALILSGIDAVIMYNGQIFGTLVDEFDKRNYTSLSSNIVFLISCIISVFFVNKIGLKTILMYGAFLISIF